MKIYQLKKNLIDFITKANLFVNILNEIIFFQRL